MPVQTTTLMRRHLRFTRYLPVKCGALRPGQPERTLIGRTQDISVGGLGLLLPETLPVGISLWVEVDQADYLLGRVVWVGKGMPTLRGTAFLHGVTLAQSVDPALVRKWESNPKQRTHDRVPVQFDVEYTEQGKTGHGTCLNLSRGGMFVQTQQPLLSGTEVLLHFMPPGLSQPFLIRGQVVWSWTEQTELGSVTGMGIQFHDPTPPETHLLETTIGHLYTEAYSSQDSIPPPYDYS